MTIVCRKHLSVFCIFVSISFTTSTNDTCAHSFANSTIQSDIRNEILQNRQTLETIFRNDNNALMRHIIGLENANKQLMAETRKMFQRQQQLVYKKIETECQHVVLKMRKMLLVQSAKISVIMEGQKNITRIVNRTSETPDCVCDHSETQTEESTTSTSVPVPQKGANVYQNCLEAKKKGQRVTGVYNIRPRRSNQTFQVLCNMEGGWTYVLRRFDGSQNFFLYWEDYKKGFGDLNSEFWLGLEHLYELTSSEENELLIELVDWDNELFYAKYDHFKIGREEEAYKIKVIEGFTGNSPDVMSKHLNFKFSSKDRDQDDSFLNCASVYHGAWWYGDCENNQLTGSYLHSEIIQQSLRSRGIWWGSVENVLASCFKEASMMVRPRT